MAKKKNSDDPKKPEDPKQNDEQQEQEPDREQPKHDSHGREHEVHREILERRMRGGAEPTPEEYSQALEEWKKLPGSVVRPPTDIKHKPEKESTGEEDQNESTTETQEDSSQATEEGTSESQPKDNEKREDEK